MIKAVWEFLTKPKIFWAWTGTGGAALLAGWENMPDGVKIVIVALAAIGGNEARKANNGTS